MWTLSSISHQAGGSINPSKTLYEFNGPLIFTAVFGYVEAFFIKFDENEEADLFLAVQVDEKTVDLIQEGRLSVLSALDREFYWIVEAVSLKIKRYWVCSRNDFPVEFLPEKNVALQDRFGLVPNSLAQLNSFFSVDYQGKNLSRNGMKFSTFKGLVDSTYDAARNILSPIVLLGSKSANFDFNISEPVFSSLVISIQQPTVNRTVVARKIRGHDIDISEVQEQFSQQRDNFFDEMGEIVSQAEKGNIKDSLVEERFSLLDRVQPIIPTEENQLDSVMFSANQGNKYSHLLVSEKAGSLISKAFRQGESRPVEEFGTVDVSNDPSCSFVLLSRRGKQVTCYVGYDNYEVLKADSRFRNGVTIRVRGRLTRRPRRDVLHVDGAPTILV